MKLHSMIGGIGLTCVLASAASAQVLDDFDSYATGPLAAQSVWEEWTGSTGVDADVDTTYSFTAPNAVVIVSTNDVVYDFSNMTGGRPDSGKWIASIKTFVATGTTGSAWYILMNEYPSPLNWSVQIQFDASAGSVYDGSSKKKKLKYDVWVTLVVAVDLDNNRYDAWYGNVPLSVNKVWQAGGSDEIAALDLYGDSGSSGSSGMYFDDMRMEIGAGGPLALTSSPNPVAAGQTLDLYSESPLLVSGDPGALFSWTVNGGFYIAPIFFVNFDAAGEWKLGTVVPTGLSGIEAGLKMFAVPTGGKVMISNEDIILFL